MKTIIDYTEEIKAYADYKAGTSLVQIPSVVGDTFTYDGTQQGPTITGLDTTKCTVTNATKINAGTYTLTIALNDTSKMMWDDLTTADKTYSYTINKANGAITLSKNSVSLDTSTPSDTVTFSGNTGAVTVSSSDDTIATASVSNDTITITAVDSGTATITVDVAESDNYNSTSASISVEVAMKPALVPWSTGTDEEITAMVNGYYNGSVTLEEIKSVWSVGDSRDVLISSMEATGVGESHAERTYPVVILDFNVINLSPAQGDKVKALVAVELRGYLWDGRNTKGRNNTENGYMYRESLGGWQYCNRRTWCNNVFYNALPTYMKNLVKSSAQYSNKAGSTSTSWLVDYCWLPSESQVTGTTTRSGVSLGSQLAYYKTTSNRYKLPKYDTSSSAYVSGIWWLRSSANANTTSFNCITYTGGQTNMAANSANGISPAWCL